MIKNRIRYAAVFAAVLALFLFYLNFFFFYLLLAVILLPIVSLVLSSRIAAKTEITASVSVPSIGAGNPVPVTFTVKNPTFFPLPGLKAEFTAENCFYPNSEIQEIDLPLRSGTHSYGWGITSLCAGNIKLCGKKLTIKDYLGLFRFKRELCTECICPVFPAVSDIVMEQIDGLFTRGEEQTADASNTVEDVTQIKEFREYRPGDRLQRVNWKLSARHDGLFVKEYEREYDRTLTLLLELRRDSDETGSLDEVITAFYSAAEELIDREQRFSVRWYDCEKGALLSESIDDADSLTDAVTRVFMSASYTDFHAFEHYSREEHRAGSMTLYFTSPAFPEREEHEIIGAYNERVSVICL